MSNDLVLAWLWVLLELGVSQSATAFLFCCVGYANNGAACVLLPSVYVRWQRPIKCSLTTNECIIQYGIKLFIDEEAPEKGVALKSCSNFIELRARAMNFSSFPFATKGSTKRTMFRITGKLNANFQYTAIEVTARAQRLLRLAYAH